MKQPYAATFQTFVDETLAFRREAVLLAEVLNGIIEANLLGQGLQKLAKDRLDAFYKIHLGDTE